MSEQHNGIRLDKWLWVARFYKTRALAREMIEGGKVHYNGIRSKPSKLVEVGATIRLRQGDEEKTVIVTGLAMQRGNAMQAQTLYNETEQSINDRNRVAQLKKLNALTMPHPDRRPEKKERRHLIDFKHHVHDDTM